MRNIGWLFLLLPVALLVSPGKAGSSQKGPSAFAAALEVGPVVVGQPSRIDWRLTEGKSAGMVPARLTLLITHLEKGKRVFFLNAIPTEGRFSLRFHFTDGSAYRITSIGWVQGSGPIQEEREINVTAVEPPREAIYPSLLLFLAVIALGLVAGRLSRRKAS